MAAGETQSVVERVVRRGMNGIGPEAARKILRMKFAKADLARIHDLSVKAKRGALSYEQQAEFHGLLQLGSLLTQMHSRARMALKRAEAPPKRKAT